MAVDYGAAFTIKWQWELGLFWDLWLLCSWLLTCYLQSWFYLLLLKNRQPNRNTLKWQQKSFFFQASRRCYSSVGYTQAGFRVNIIKHFNNLLQSSFARAKPGFESWKKINPMHNLPVCWKKKTHHGKHNLRLKVTFKKFDTVIKSVEVNLFKVWGYYWGKAYKLLNRNS